MNASLARLALILLSAGSSLAQSEPEKPGREIPELIERLNRGDAADGNLRRALEQRGKAELMLPLGGEAAHMAALKRHNEEARLKKSLGIPSEAELDLQIWRWFVDEVDKSKSKAWLIGLVVEPLHASVRRDLGLNEGTGLRVREVVAASPADRAGIRAKDIIISVDGSPATSREDLLDRVNEAGRSGKALKLAWLRGDRGEAEVRPEGPRRADPAGLLEPAPAQSPMFKRMEAMNRRLELQQEELDKLRREVERLKEERK